MKRKQWMAALFLSILCAVSLPAAERVLLRGGTPVHVRLKAEIDSARAAVGDRVDLELNQPLVRQGVVVAPEGAVAWGGVQAVNKGKSVRFDVQGMRLPNLLVVKLRSVREKTNNPGKDLIKVDQGLVPRGSEFVAYVDDDVSVEAVARAAAPAPHPVSAVMPAAPPPEAPKPAAATAPAPTPAAAPVPTPVSVPVQAKPTPAPEATPPPVTPVEPAAPAPVPAPATTAPVPASGGMETVTDWVTVECFSVPSGADILIDGDFYGNTPSILKLPAGKHRLRFILADYAPSSQELDLAAVVAIHTIRVELEKKEP